MVRAYIMGYYRPKWAGMDDTDLLARRSDLSGGLLLQDTLLGLLLGGHGCVGARAGGNVRWGAGRHILEARARVQGALLCDGLVFPIMVSNGP